MKKLLLLLTFAASLPAQTSTRWFTYTNGNNTCWVDKVSQTPIKVTYLCTNPYGSEGGSYTANPTNIVPAGNIFILRSGSTDASNSTVICFIAINATQQPLTMGNFGTLPPTSAAYSCSGTATGTISWP